MKRVACFLVVLCLVFSSVQMQIFASEISDTEKRTDTVSQSDIQISDSDIDVLKEINETVEADEEKSGPQEDSEILGEVLENENVLYPEGTGGVKSKLDSVLSNYPEGSTWNGSWGGATQCFGFARMIFSKVFGCEMPAAYKGAYRYIYSTNTNVTLVGRLEGNNVTATNLKSIFSNAKVGDIIQGCGGTYGQHTMILYSVTSSGITFYDCNSGGTNKVKYGNRTWASLASRYSGYSSTYGNNGISIYRANNYDTVDYVAEQPIDKTPPTIHFIYVTDVSKDGYTVVCQVTDESGIDRVQFPTYTDANGRDDMVSDWSTSTRIRGTYIGNNTYSFRVNVSEHNYEGGMYVTEIFAYDKFGNQKGLAENEYVRQNVDTTPPTIHFIYVTDVSKDGYTVVCQATDESGIDRVQFPTYTDANGRDDMVSDWSTSTRIRGTYIGNNTYSFRVNVSEHNYERGMYVTEIFVYDKFGNQKGLAENEYVRQNVDTTPPSSLGDKVDLGSSFNAYIKTEYGTYLTADSNNDVRARSGNGQLSQKWTFTRTSDGYYLIRNKMNGYGLDADGGFDISATNIKVHNPHFGANQKWGAYDAGNGSYYLSPESSKITVMDSPSFDQDGGNIYLYQFHGGQNQKFLIQKYDRYAVTLNSTTGGTVSGAGTYNNGTTVTLKATPKSGYEFVGWYSGTTKVSASQNYSFTINNNVIYTAEFKIIENAPSTPSTPSEPSVPSTPTKPVTPTNNTDTQIRSFVSRMYIVALGRDAEKAGLDDWSKQLINHTNDGAGLARGFICSDEFTGKNMSNDAYVNTLYKTFFNREPDASGKANWMNALNNGTSRNEVLAGFVNSLEFANLCDKYGIARGTLENNGSSIYNAGVRDFVLRMYTKCLNRDGETVGVEDWTNRINTKVMSPEAVAKSFFSSQEFINHNLNNADYVETLYQTFMDRASDEGGKQYWLNQLNNGMSRQQVLEGFSRSEEFSKIMKRYGL